MLVILISKRPVLYLLYCMYIKSDYKLHTLIKDKCRSCYLFLTFIIMCNSRYLLLSVTFVICYYKSRLMTSNLYLLFAYKAVL